MVLANNNFWIRCTLIVLFGALTHLCESRVLIEGDMMVKSALGNVQQKQQQIRTVRSKRSIVVDKTRESFWESGIVPYEIDTKVGFSDIQIGRIKEAMKHWERYTCIIFVERNATEHMDFIRLTRNDSDCGCCSYTGKIGGEQEVIIDKCDFGDISDIVHVLGHAIGFYHEHQRPDRDQYVEFNENNLKRNSTGDLKKLKLNQVDTLDEPYDFESIMHYSQYFFQPKEGKNGVVPKLDENKRLSAIDIKKTNKIYCPKCSRAYFDQKAAFTSPEYYSKSKDRTYKCEWRITLANQDRIEFVINDLDIFESNGCKSDYLEVRDGHSLDSPLLGRGRFCGVIPFHRMVSNGNRLFITYVSNHTEHRGFAAGYKAYYGKY